MLSKIPESPAGDSRRFRQMADHAPVMIWMSGIDKACTWFNKPWLEFTGRTLEQELGDGWAEGVHPEDLPRCLEIYSTEFDARCPFTMEYRLRRHDGQWRWVLDNGIPLYENGGVFEGYIGSCIDVTDRRQTEDALREREDRLQAILNTVGDAIITFDRFGAIIAANPAAGRMFGYTTDELVGRNVNLLTPPATYDNRDLQPGHAQGIGEIREVTGLRKDGSTFSTELAVSEVEHRGWFTAVHRDISVRKQTEQKLDQYQRDLRTMSSELMLAEERERQRLAQDLHDGLGQALFRARLKLDEMPEDNETAAEIAAILEDVGKMVNTMTFELSPPVLRQLGFRLAVRWLARDMQQRYGLSVRIDDDGQDVPLAERAALVLFRSVRELLINVAKHAQTQVAILSLRRTDHIVQVEVGDRGKGFDLANQTRLVESGHFGLFSIQERLDYLGGTFKIQSSPGEGTTVTLAVPLATAKLAAGGQ